MGDHSRNSRERRQMVPNKSISFSHLALIVILVIIVTAFPTHASPLEPYKRGRSSSLIPFPRVGRSVPEPLQSEDSENSIEDEEGMLRSTRSSKSQFYGQKRTVRKRQALIPFPRTGKRSSIQPHKYQDNVLGGGLKNLIALSAMEGDSERYVYPREYETIQLIQSLLRELQNDK